MIKGTGIDIVEITRIERLIAKGSTFTEKVFSEKETEYCLAQSKPSESFAGKFAAKEAFLKAIGTGWRGKIALNEIEILNDDLGKPILALIGGTKAELPDLITAILHVTISHSAQYAVAMVILEDVIKNEKQIGK